MLGRCGTCRLILGRKRGGFGGGLSGLARVLVVAFFLVGEVEFGMAVWKVFIA